MPTDKQLALAALQSARQSIAAAELLMQSWSDEAIYRVQASDDLQAALDQAATDTSGLDVRLLLDPTGRWPGNFQLKPKTHNRHVFVQPDFDPANLGPGRIDPTRTDLPTLLGTGVSLPVLATIQSRGWTFLGLHFDKTVASRGIVELGSTTATDPAQVGGDWAFVQCRFLGDPIKYQKRAIVANGGALIVDRCDLRQIGYNGEDGQCILGYNGPGPYTITGSFLSGGAEPILFGGGGCKAPAMVPSDILIRGNHVSLDYQAWQANKWTVKNLFEIKNAQRVLVEGNLFEHCWRHGQDGTAIVLKAAGYEAPPTSRHCQAVYRLNVVRHAGAFLGMIYSESQPTLGTDDIEIADNVVYDLATGTWTGTGRGFGFGGRSSNVRVVHNTLPDLKHAFSYSWNDPAVDAMPGYQCRGNLAREGQYGVFGAKTSAQGLPTISDYFPGSAWDANCFEDAASSARYPSGTLIVPPGTLAGGALDPQFRVVDPQILAHVGADGRPPGADVDAILALFAQYGISW